MDEERPHDERPISRRNLLKAGAAGAVGLTAAGGALGFQRAGQQAYPDERRAHPHVMGSKRDVDTSRFDPTAFLKDFDYGKVSTLPDGQTLREYELVARDVEIEVAPGVYFPAWTYNGQVPGPTIRCTEGDRIRVHFSNAGSHPHTIHFHGIHAANMDGVFEIVEPGGSFVYEFDARPAGLHLYHCHAVPLKRHIHKGLYGAFIVDPADRDLEPADEMVMVMNGFDTNFDGDNEVYAVNTVAFHYQNHPIPVELGELVRIYLVNMTEFDFVNSFHLHGNFFRYWPTGTRPEQYEYTDTVLLCQGQRGIMEFTYDDPGMFMFHAHQSEFAELGWMGFFDVREEDLRA
ncbi:MAG: multicopper oxidase domain-containing protein [Gemmatimonadetes bacterium]|nr:multicopper oxidase domain-containing protein [Gemmatimonadota bacterium]NIR80950.1 multicopper oxidase domain-containing protein [Gemmatimonadota bacterium]NIT89768.1 multicopper oxidase domain-containing protein [Gemmatimonadota bacterium]NIU33554.1 multicopper oxidase domain-containing protein [Gemmatimonadota bacterium]NIU37823.1 multicopper oxidase domain-containing protein [Gemmatimonadota bacterium]